MAYISLRTFQPTLRFTGSLARHTMLAFAAIRFRHQAFRQRRGLAGLSMLELKDFGYPVDEAPADVAARSRNLEQFKRT